MKHNPIFTDKKVLIIDDNDMICAAMNAISKELGMIPHIEHHAKHALHIMEHGNFDIAFLDYRMPDMDGVKLFNIVQATMENPPPIVFITGTFIEDIAEQFVNSKKKPAGYLAKPFMLEELIAILEKIFTK